MEIARIAAINAVSPGLAIGGAAPAGATGSSDLGRMFSDLLNQLSATEKGTTGLVSRVATGGDVDVHDVMIATQAESLAFQIGLQVRNKLVEAYQEVFRMQV